MLNNKSHSYRIVLSLLLLQIVLYCCYINRVLNNTYPINYDQTRFILVSYEMYESIVCGDYPGFLSCITLDVRGFLVPLLGMFMLFAFGHSRTSLLLVNLLAVLTEELVGGYFVFRITKNKRSTILFESLLLASSTGFFWAGDFLDFRCDFFAGCFYSCWVITTAAAIHSKNARTSYLSILMAVILIAARTISLVYIGLTLALFFIYAALRYRDSFKRCFFSFLKYGGILMVVLTPYFAKIVFPLYSYYLYHVIGDEKEFRMIENGVTGVFDYFTYYPQSLVKDHLGIASACIMGLITVFIVLRVILCKGNNIHLSGEKRDTILWSCFAIITPILVLTIDEAKSPVVVGVVVGSIAFLASVTYSFIAETNYSEGSDRKTGKLITRIETIVIAIAVCIGLLTFFKNITYMRPGYTNVRGQQTKKVNMLRSISDYVSDNDSITPSFFLDRKRDWLHCEMIRLFVYENRNKFITPIDQLVFKHPDDPRSDILWDYDKSIVDSALRASDIVVISPDDYVDDSIYPYDITIQEYRPYVYEYCRDNLELLCEDSIDGQHIQIYIRGDVSISDNGGWILKDGCVISINKASDALSLVEFRGKTDSHLPDDTSANCQVDGVTLPCMFRIDEDHSYTLSIDLSSLDKGNYEGKLSFSDSFNPAKLGINDDDRELVIMKPEEYEIKQPVLR